MKIIGMSEQAEMMAFTPFNTTTAGMDMPIPFEDPDIDKDPEMIVTLFSEQEQAEMMAFTPPTPPPRGRTCQSPSKIQTSMKTLR
jgi:hypothetical protein